MNYEIIQKLEREDVIKKIKEQKVRWLGHVNMLHVKILNTGMGTNWKKKKRKTKI